MSIRQCRQAWGRLACMAILAAIAGVLAACGAGPGAKAQPDPVKIKDVVFEKVGADNVKIPLGDKFSGSELTYTATSSDKAVATVAIDNDDDILTVKAIGAGEATITVTAADSQDRTASQTFKVTVKATTSEPEPGAPAVKDDAPTSVDFEAGESTTETVTLSDVFEGDGLTYSAPESDDTDVAIASISNGVLIIRAGDPGGATITVTATNAKGEAEHEITVTVPEDDGDGDGEGNQDTANSTTCKSSLTRLRINLGKDWKCTINDDHTLKAVDDTAIKTHRSADGETDNVWLIVALKKGDHTISISDGDGEPAGNIMVKVPNSIPERVTIDNVPTTDKEADHPNPHSLTLESNENEETALNTEGAYFEYPFSPPPVNYFTDPDAGDEDTLRYRVEDKPDWVLIETESSSFIKFDGNEMTLEVLQKVAEGKKFTVSIKAVDVSGGVSTRPVVLTFEVPTVADSNADDLVPRYMMYDATQTQNGDLRAKNGVLTETVLKVGPRRGVPHTLEFENSFAFANSLDTKHSVTRGTATFYYYKKGSDYCKSDDASCEHPVKLPTTQNIADLADGLAWAVGFNFFVVESSSPVVAKWGSENAVAKPALEFELEEKGPSGGGITIKYYVVPAGSDGSTPATSARSDNRSLRIDVVTCSSPRNPIKDCY